MIVSIGGICFLVSQAAILGWDSVGVWAVGLLTLIAIITFLFNMRTASNPVLPASLLLNRAFLLGAAVFFADISVSWVVSFYIPLYLRQAVHYTVIQAALWFSIMTCMTVIAPVVAGIIYDKISKPLITHIAFLASLSGLLLFTLFTVQASVWMMAGAFVIFGLAWGVGNGIGTPIGLLAVKGAEDAGAISGALLTLLNVGVPC